MFGKNRLIRFINQNRKNLIKILVIIICVIGGIQLLNLLAKNKNMENKNENINRNTYKPEDTVITGNSIPTEKISDDSTIINEFITLCNNGEIEKAYGKLSNECKENVYPTLDDFKNIYYSNNFKEKKDVKIQSWISYGNSNTYRVNLLDNNILSTGNYNSSEKIEDYFTIVKYADGDKLNISNYIGEQKINKSSEKSGITINIESVERYMEYEIYNIEVINNSDKDILLDTRETNKTLNIIGKNKTKYSSFINELAEDILITKAKTTKKISIKFNKYYKPESVIESMIFSDIVTDYQKYKSMQGSSEYNDKLSISIDI